MVTRMVQVKDPQTPLPADIPGRRASQVCGAHLESLHVHLMPSFLACRWEKDDQYCVKSLLLPSSDYYPILMDVMDSSVFDFLMGIFFLYKRS